MADKKISDLTAATSVADGDLLLIENSGGNSRKVDRANFRQKFRGAKAWMTADDTTQNITTQTAITFDAAVFDTDSFWAGGAPTRITIPSGITYAELVGQVIISSGTADTGLGVYIVHRNSSNTILRSFGNFGFIEQSGTQRGLQVHTGPVAVSSGDYFTLEAREETDTSVTIEGDGGAGGGLYETFLAIKVLE